MTLKVQTTLIRKIIDGRDVGGYAVPDELITAAEVTEMINGIPSAVAPHPDPAAAGARFLAASLKAGKPADLAAAGKQLVAEKQAYQASIAADEVRAQAREQAEYQLANLGRDLVETIIVDYLRPAFTETMTLAAEHSKVLGDHLLDTLTLMTAPAAIRDAYAELARLENRRQAIQQARMWANTLGERQPQMDASNLYALARDPRALFPGLGPNGAVPMDWGIPTTPVERILWWVRDGEPAQPWLPTVEDQDRRWDEVHGDAMRTQQNITKFAMGLRPEQVANR